LHSSPTRRSSDLQIGTHKTLAIHVKHLIAVGKVQEHTKIETFINKFVIKASEKLRFWASQFRTIVRRPYRIAIRVGLASHRKVFYVTRFYRRTVLTFKGSHPISQGVATIAVLHEVVCRVHTIVLIAIKSTDRATYAGIKVDSGLITGDHVVVAGASEKLPHLRTIECHIESRPPLEVLVT